MWCCGLEAGRHNHFQWRSLLWLLLAPIHYQTSTSQGKEQEGSLATTEEESKSVSLFYVLYLCHLVSPTGFTDFITPWAPAVGQSLQREKKKKKSKRNNSNCNRLNYLSFMGDWSLVLETCGQKTLNHVTQKSNEGQSQLASRQRIRRAHKSLLPGLPRRLWQTPASLPCLELPAPFRRVRHDAHGIGRPLLSRQALC